MQFTLDQILALAPDDASAKAAKGLLAPAKWPTLGSNDVAVWGECQGSGSKPYQTQIDLNGPAFRCSCPSRKFPCKHGLALFILRVQHTGSFSLGASAPAWVSEWLGTRQEKAARQEAKAVAATTVPAKPVDEAAVAKRDAKRSNRIAAGVDELERWLQDQIRGGIGGLESAAPGIWDTLAARMIDAQAPGLALRVRQLGEAARQGRDWPALLLSGMGRLQLLLEASRQEGLTPEQLADMRYALGQTAAKEDVLAHGEKITDDWTVMGLHVEERERLWERRVWLLGRTSGRTALLLDFAHGTARFADSWVSGTSQTATLAFYPGAAARRAVIDPAQHRAACPLASPEFGTLETALQDLADALAANPWQSPLPLRIARATPFFHERHWWLQDSSGHALPLQLGSFGWPLLAITGGQAVNVFGEWDGDTLLLLSVWQEQQLWAAGARTGSSNPQATKLLHTLSRIALVGTGRQTSPFPATNGAIGQLLRSVESQSISPEAALLRAAGIASICAAAGYEPMAITVNHSTAGVETAPVADSPALYSALADLLSEGPERLQFLAVHRLAQARSILPHPLLPTALDVGRSRSQLRELLLPVLGQRGAWLATQNPDWRWALALPDDDSAWDWETATQDQRLNWLTANFAGQAEQARHYIRQSFATASARERLQLLEKLVPFVSMDDEAFLTGLLKDRSKEIRQTTARLLSALPGSEFAKTMGGRMAALLGKRRKLLREAWEFSPPDAFDPEWKKDSIEEEKPAHETMGERAWWALQLVRLTPLVWWQQHTGMRPAALLEWAKDGDWQQVLLGGWLQALESQDAPDWAEAWLSFSAPKKIHVQPYQLLLKVAQEKRESHWLTLLQALKSGDQLGQHLGQLVASLAPGALISSRALAEAILGSLRNYPLQRDYQLMHTLPDLACVLPDTVLPFARDTALHETLARIGSQDSAGRFARIIEQRLILNSALQDETP